MIWILPVTNKPRQILQILSKKLGKYQRSRENLGIKNLNDSFEIIQKVLGNRQNHTQISCKLHQSCRLHDFVKSQDFGLYFFYHCVAAKILLNEYF